MLSRIAWYLVFLLAIVLSLKSLREPDLWWMLRTGEWIVEHQTVPKEDVFSFTVQGTPWINVKWLFEVLISLFKSIGGAEFVLVLQACITVGIVVFIRKTVQLLQPVQDNPQATNLGLILTFLTLLITVDFRLIGRPEMISHFFTVVYIYLFVRYGRENGNKLLYVLIPLQCLWANMHEAFGLGMILLGAFAIGLWLDYFLLKKQLPNALRPVLIGNAVAVIAILSVMIHPYGFRMLLHPFEIYGQLQTNKFTSELASFTSFEYWHLEAYLNIAFLVLSIIGFLLVRKTYQLSQDTSATFAFAQAGGGGVVGFLITGFVDLKNNLIRTFSSSFILIYGLLFYLSLTAYRNIPFFIFISSILVIGVVQFILSKYLYKRISANITHFIGIALGASLYIFIITGQYHTLKGDQNQYGLQIQSGRNPVAAATFLQQNNIKGKCFSDYLLSSYLLWKLQPDFKTFIDLRDLDVFTSEQFSQFAEMVFVPPMFVKKDSTERFDYVVLFHKEFGTLNTHLVNSPDYDLVFADPVSSIFLRKSPQFEPLIAKYGFNANGRKDIFSKLPVCESSSLSYTISKIFNPLYNIEDYSKTDQDYLAGIFYNGIGEYNLAQVRAEKTYTNGIEKWRGHELLGNIYNNKAGLVNDSTNRNNLLIQAISEYDKALKENPYALESLVGKGIAYIQRGKQAEAIPYLKRALGVSPNSFSANKYLAYCFKIQYYNVNPNAHNLDNWLKHTQVMNRLNPENPFILLDLGIAYCAKNDCANAMEYLSKIMNFPNLPPDEYSIAKECYKKCGGK